MAYKTPKGASLGYRQAEVRAGMHHDPRAKSPADFLAKHVNRQVSSRQADMKAAVKGALGKARGGGRQRRDARGRFA